MTCLPGYCAYCEHYGYVTYGTPGGGGYKSLYTCKHPDSNCFEMIHTGSRPLCELAISSYPSRIGIFNVGIGSCGKRQKKFVVPCMKKGNWHTRLVEYRLIGFQRASNKNDFDTHFVGVFNTAQEAYVHAGIYIKSYPFLFKNGVLPTHLIMELTNHGKYPDNVEEQFLLPYLQGREVPYMDKNSIMLPERILERRDVLKTLIDIKVSENKLSWKLK